VKYSFLIILAFLTPTFAMAQTSGAPVQGLPYKAAVGSDKSKQKHTEPAMYPAAKSQQ
jgi:hypothetical protein